MTSTRMVGESGGSAPEVELSPALREGGNSSGTVPSSRAVPEHAYPPAWPRSAFSSVVCSGAGSKESRLCGTLGGMQKRTKPAPWPGRL